MDFDLTPEQKAFRDSVRDFARRELAKGALERAHSSDYPWDVATRMAELGLIGITVAEDDGGGGGTLMDAVIAIEQIAAVCPRSADVVQAGNFGALRVLAQYGTADQKKRYLEPLLRGEGVICVAMTEPDAGSAMTDLKTTATPDGDGFRINGSKIFTTHGLHASVFLVYVRFGPGVDGIGSVLIERGAEGFTFGAPASLPRRRGLEPALLRQRLRARRERAARPGRVQEADERLQRRAHRQQRALARSGPLLLRARAGACADAPAVRPPAGRVPGPAVEVRGHEDQARRGTAAALPRGGQRRHGLPVA